MKLTIVTILFASLPLGLMAMSKNEQILSGQLVSKTVINKTTSKEKVFNIDTDLIEDGLGIVNIKARYKIAAKSTLGVTFYDYNIKTTASKTLTIAGNGIGAEYMYFIGGPALSDSSFIKTEINYTSLNVADRETNNRRVKLRGIDVTAGAEGILAFIDYGYNWQWDYISLNVFTGLQYYNLKAKAKATDQVNTVEHSAGISGISLDLGLQMGVSF